ncbi:unnamed protein product [Anisakis simplex]|uniref:Rhodanese domain-containing protein n=1 Tax=Anisakis simplex TaxID=6269 RepID=A0A0M3J2D6_ANISI|nr:unnamed protein product [Anisakis simplex]VDK57542.1 unnamed protein product [Anisakis simplex]
MLAIECAISDSSTTTTQSSLKTSAEVPSSNVSSSSHASDTVNVNPSKQVSGNSPAVKCTLQGNTTTTDVTQKDDYEIFACSIIAQMIENLRLKQIRDQDARVVLIRRGETVTDVFPDWTKNAFNQNGEYVPFDLNMPSSIRRRERIDDFLLDPPLTNIGAHLSRQLGLSMVTEVPTVIYTSPQVADIQTGRKLLEGIPVGVGWNIEPGLAGFYPVGTKCPS